MVCAIGGGPPRIILDDVTHESECEIRKTQIDSRRVTIRVMRTTKFARMYCSYVYSVRRLIGYRPVKAELKYRQLLKEYQTLPDPYSKKITFADIMEQEDISRQATISDKFKELGIDHCDKKGNTKLFWLSEVRRAYPKVQ